MLVGVHFELFRSQRKYDFKYRRRIMYSMIVLMILLQASMWFYIKLKRESIQELKPEVQSQIEKLGQIEEALNDLKGFIDAQKSNLREAENRLNKLNEERDKLKPIVDADRKTIDALFSIQDERNRKNIWYERFIGAFFGILSSLIAALLFRLFTSRKENLRDTNGQP